MHPRPRTNRRRAAAVALALTTGTALWSAPADIPVDDLADCMGFFGALEMELDLRGLANANTPSIAQQFGTLLSTVAPEMPHQTVIWDAVDTWGPVFDAMSDADLSGPPTPDIQGRVTTCLGLYFDTLATWNAYSTGALK